MIIQFDLMGKVKRNAHPTPVPKKQLQVAVFGDTQRKQSKQYSVHDLASV